MPIDPWLLGSSRSPRFQIRQTTRNIPVKNSLRKIWNWYIAGIERMAQKVGEEGVEVALAAVSQIPEKLTEEAADLLFHLLVLLKEEDLSIDLVIKQLKSRRSNSHTDFAVADIFDILVPS